MSIKNHLNYPVFKQRHKEIAKVIIECHQQHLCSDWHPSGQENESKKQFLETLIQFDTSYPGGLKSYLQNSRRLLAESKRGKNYYSGFVPQQPDTVNLSNFDANYLEMEQRGLAQADKLAFVLVAGGLGERLGYNGLKIDIPFELTTKTSYLAYYAQYLKALEARSASKINIPLIIMTSPETDELTQKSLRENNYFGLKEKQIILVKQALVPALSNNEAFLAKSSPYKLILKPHGHGDIHLLMHGAGIANELLAKGISHLVFIQDTNAQVCNAILPTIGVSIKNDFTFNSIGVPRVPKEAVGAITKLVSKPKSVTINVEYNQLDSLLKESHPDGDDIAKQDGYSSFPGNINALVVRLKEYADILNETKGIIAEFVNPKYKDESKTQFKKPTRLETMMQDLPKLFTEAEKVGVTIFNRIWTFSADKNNPEEAAQKNQAGQPFESAVSAESDFYEAGRMKILFTKNTLQKPNTLYFRQLPFKNGARVILKPNFAITLNEVKEKISGCFLSNQSSLILDGVNIYLNNVTLKNTSALHIKVAPGVTIKVDGLILDNQGYQIEPLSQEEIYNIQTPQYLSMRGYNIINKGALIIDIQKPGNYLLDKDGNIKKQ